MGVVCVVLAVLSILLWVLLLLLVLLMLVLVWVGVVPSSDVTIRSDGLSISMLHIPQGVLKHRLKLLNAYHNI